MAQTIRIKRSGVAGKKPSVSDLSIGELGINYYDGKLFLKRNNGTESVIEVGGDAVRYTLASSAPLNPNIGDEWTDSTNGRTYKYINDGDSAQWFEFGPSATAGVESVNGQTGEVVLSASDVGAATSAQGLLADSALQPEDIGSTVQGYNANTVIDASYVHTDNNYTTSEKSKLSGIQAGAEVNVNADWNAASGDAQILNKPSLGTAAAASTGDFATAAQGGLADTAVQPSDDINTISGILNTNKGGTGQSSYTQGDVLVGTSAGSLEKSSQSTGAIIIPIGTTAQRPGSPVAGMIRFNSELNQFEGYNGTQWGSLGAPEVVFNFEGDLETLTGTEDLELGDGVVDLMGDVTLIEGDLMDQASIEDLQSGFGVVDLMGEITPVDGNLMTQVGIEDLQTGFGVIDLD